LIVNTINHDPL